MTPGSDALQSRTLPLFLANWSLPEGSAETVELGHGVSLVLLDSDPVFRGAPARGLARALKRARGPWRVLLTHHPIAVAGRHDRERYTGYRERMLAEIEQAGVPVQLVLSGHEHNLQALVMEPPAPALHIVAGGGSSGRSIHDENPRRRAGFESAGYARVDLVGEGESERLVATLMRVPKPPLHRLVPSRFAARFSVDRLEHVREE
jgi:hypothetical protein